MCCNGFILCSLDLSLLMHLTYIMSQRWLLSNPAVKYCVYSSLFEIQTTLTVIPSAVQYGHRESPLGRCPTLPFSLYFSLYATLALSSVLVSLPPRAIGTTTWNSASSGQPKALALSRGPFTWEINFTLLSSLLSVTPCRLLALRAAHMQLLPQISLLQARVCRKHSVLNMSSLRHPKQEPDSELASGKG